MSSAEVNRSGDPATPRPLFDELEDQLARAVTVALAGALDAFKESLSQTITEAVRELSDQLAAAVAERSAASAWVGPDYDEITAAMQHSVLMALAQYEPRRAAPTTASRDPLDTPATARDVARINQRIDDLRSLLLG